MDQKKIGLFSATFLGVTSIIGSGWLFAPYRSAVIAGPASLLAWVIGAGLIILLALCLSEIAACYPKRGLTAIISTLSHNKYFGFPFAIANWLGIVAVIGLEADATVQYLINMCPDLAPILYDQDHLTLSGNCLSIGLVLIYCVLNYWGAAVLAKTNNIVAILKILVPVMVSLIIISVAFHPQNFRAPQHSFFPYGAKSVFVAILSSGIIVAYNGFQSIVSFASEIKNPHRTIPLSLVGAIVFCLAIYLLLSMAFIGGMPPQRLSNGWHALQLSAPMIELTLLLGLGALASIIYFGAALAPSGAGVVFTGSATRMLTAMSRQGQMPTFFDHTHPIYKLSRRSLLMTIVLAVVFLCLFRSWSDLAGFLSLLHIVSYLSIPIALCTFRRALKNHVYSFKVWGGQVMAVSLFVAFTYLFTLADLRPVSWMFSLLALAQIIFMLLTIESWVEWRRALKQVSLLAIYFIGLWIMTALSPSNYGYLTEGVFGGIVVVFALLCFYGLINFECSDDQSILATVQAVSCGQ